MIHLPKIKKMPPHIPLEAGKVYHIYNRGIDGTPIFHTPKNYSHFLETYAKYCDCVVDTYAYCLLGNHFHILVRVKEVLPIYADLYPEIPKEKQTEKVFETVNPNRQFSHFFNSYDQYFNHSRSPKRTGKLLEEPFERILVENDYYFSNLVHYIHFNPQKHDFRDYPYSSYHSHLSKKNTLLKRNEVLDWFGNRSEYQLFHQQDMNEQEIGKWIIEVD
jgi:putative transposase